MSAAPIGGHEAASDPSMEDILASIRRILSEDEQHAGMPAMPAAHETAPREVLALDASMMVEEPSRVSQSRPVERAMPPDLTSPAPVFDDKPSPLEERMPMQAEPPDQPPAPSPDLVAPAAAAAAASSVGSLLRTLGSGRSSLQVTRAGVTLEDIVRDEIRPLVKAWLDTNLPSMVERLVRAEIERVVGRAADL